MPTGKPPLHPGNDAPAAEGASPAPASGVLKRWLPLFVLAAVAAVVVWQGWYRYLTLDKLAENREALRAFLDHNFLLALGAYMAIYIVATALSLPGGIILTLAGGFLFGWLVGGLATVVAATIGATIVFLIAKTSFGEPLAARAGPWLAKLRDGFRDNALSYLLFLRLVPVFPFWLVNLAPAVLGVRLPTYVMGTFFGIIPGTFAFTVAGVGLDSVIASQQAMYEQCLADKGAGGDCTFSLDPSAIVTPELLIAFVALGVVALIPTVVKKFRARRARPNP